MAETNPKKKSNKPQPETETPVSETAAPADAPLELDALAQMLVEKQNALDALQAELDAAQKDAAAAKDSLLRTAAEYDNFRKRSAREKDAIGAEATAATILSLLPVADNLDRALAHADDSGLREGLQLTARQLADTFQKMNIEIIDPAGAPFDPALHEAVLHVEDEAAGENTVVEVLQKGYRLGDRVIRYAVVKVAN